MFKLLLISLITLTLCADTNKYVPAGTVLDNAKLVSEEGWKSANNELIKHIELYKDRFLKEFFVVNDAPFSEEEYYTQGETVSFIPYFNEQYYALALTKYFESIGDNDKSIFIYNYILSGMYHSYYSYPSELGLLFRLAAEERTIKSLTNSLSNKVYSLKDKLLIKEILTHFLILNQDVLYDALTIRTKSDISLMHPVLRNGDCVTSIREGIELNIKLGEVLDIYIQLYSNFLSEMKSITSEKAYSALCKKIESDKKKVHAYENILDRFSTCQLMNDKELKRKVAKILYSKSPNWMILYDQILERIETNKALIIELDTYNSSSSYLSGLKNRSLIDMRNVLK